MNQESRLEHNPNNSNLHRKIATYVKVSAIHACLRFRVSVQGVESLWGDCRFIPADWGS